MRNLGLHQYITTISSYSLSLALSIFSLFPFRVDMVISVMLGKKLGHSEGSMAIPTCVLLTFHCVWFALFQRKTPDRNCVPTSLWFLWICFSLEMDAEMSADCVGTSCYCTCINARLMLSVELDVGFCTIPGTEFVQLVTDQAQRMSQLYPSRFISWLQI